MRDVISYDKVAVVTIGHYKVFFSRDRDDAPLRSNSGEVTLSTAATAAKTSA